MKTLRFTPGDLGEQQFHTKAGDKARRELNKVLDKSSAGDAIVIDCKTLRAFDASFVAAFSLLVSGLNEYTRLDVDLVLKEIGLMLVEVVSGKRTSLLGKYSSSDQQTLEFMMDQTEPLSVREFADRLKINATAANERLSKLAKMAILRRQSTTGGRTQQLFAAPAV